MMHERIRIMIVDDHPIVRRGLHSLLDVTPGMEVVAEATDGIEAVQKVQIYNPDVVLMDLVMPRMDGIKAIEEILQNKPETRILVLTSFEEDERLLAALRTGALGYILKDSNPDLLLQAIQDVYKGDSYLNPSVLRKLIRGINKDKNIEPVRETTNLTERELEVLILVSQGLSNQEAAKRLGVVEGTVRSHISNILSKLHLSNRTQAVVYALREGLAPLDSKEDPLNKS